MASTEPIPETTLIKNVFISAVDLTDDRGHKADVMLTIKLLVDRTTDIPLLIRRMNEAALAVGAELETRHDVTTWVQERHNNDDPN